MKPHGAISLRVFPIPFRDACEYIRRWHRHHHVPPVGHKASFAVEGPDRQVHGVATIGRPMARRLDTGEALEVTRIATDGTKNAASMLYGACLRWAWKNGAEKVWTYILESEQGTSPAAAGFTFDGIVKGRSWSCPSRPRIDKHPTCNKKRWIALCPIRKRKRTMEKVA